MDQNELATLFSDILKQMKIMENTLVNHGDALAANTETMKNLEKVNAALGNVLAQGLSANANGMLAKEAMTFLGRYLFK